MVDFNLQYSTIQHILELCEYFSNHMQSAGTQKFSKLVFDVSVDWTVEASV